jgi:transmembrane sensor
MTDHSFSQAQYDAITDTAAHCCMRLHAVDCTAEERLVFEQWRDAHPLHALEYEAMLDIWDVAGHLSRPESAISAVGIKPAKPWRTFGMAAAICALALPLAAYTG